MPGQSSDNWLKDDVGIAEPVTVTLRILVDDIALLVEAMGRHACDYPLVRPNMGLVYRRTVRVQCLKSQSSLCLVERPCRLWRGRRGRRKVRHNPIIGGLTASWKVIASV
jgi:hypothetical protein